MGDWGFSAKLTHQPWRKCAWKSRLLLSNRCLELNVFSLVLTQLNWHFDISTRAVVALIFGIIIL